MTVVALLAGAQAPVAQPTPKPTVYYLNTSFDNASPLQWQVDEDGTVQVFLLFDYERNSPNRAAGHWYFQIQGRPGSELNLVLNNFGNIYNGRLGSPVSKKSICYISPDAKDWKAVPAEFLEGTRLRLRLRLEGPSLYLARLEPYGLGDLQRLLDHIRHKPLVEITEVGKTVQGRPLEIIRIGNPRLARRVLVRARAHAWEPGGNWVVQGLILSLLSNDEIARRCLQRSCLYVLPMANKDGVARGGTRFNLLGKDLNRDWNQPADPLLAPENNALEEWIRKMAAQGRTPQLALDLHNDEAGRLHIDRPAVTNVDQHVDRMRLLETLLRKNTWFTEGSDLSPLGQNSGTLGTGLLERYGIDACILELNCNWIAGLQQYPSARAWEQFGRGLREVFYEVLWRGGKRQVSGGN